MKKYGVNELRRMYLEFFESKGHLAMKSFSLVPHNDNSLLLINAGMAPLKPYFTGQEIPPRRRVTTCQKCVRTGDIENVGKTARHLTFFEMLGNFSFGDYFKHEAIAWSWEFLTKVIGMEPDRLYPSIYGEDNEAYDIWTKEIGVPGDRITRFYRDENGECDNFWEHGAGPCGPCSEIYYDRGEKYGCGKPDCKVGCDCDRFMEVWNNVFTQFNGDGHGGYEELENKNIDTGMGLERLAVVVQDVDSVFDVDTMKAIRDKICEMAGTTYQTDEAKDVSIRLITDHIRSSTFMVSDGIMPSNEGRGYVLRRLIRRAVRHGRMLGINKQFMAELAKTVINESKDGYPELEEKKEFILNVLSQEENKFDKTIDQGLNILNQMQDELAKSGKKELAGEDAFKLYDTYGFPVDLTTEILEEKGYTVDEKGFEAAMEEQKQKARSARKTTNYMGAEETVYQQLDPALTTEFIGYDRLEADAKVIALTTDSDVVAALTDGQKGTIIVDKTPFYATMGGQQADIGTIVCADSEFKVKDTVKLLGGKVAHIGEVVKGMFKDGDTVTLKVDAVNRAATCKNHSATHLLQEALRKVLGSHVEQAGSYNDASRLRFDFTHFSAMTPDEIEKVESIVNEQVAANLPVVTEVMSLDEAKKTGAMALFGDKYGDVVRVVEVPGFSVELCGGSHVGNTAFISSFRLTSEAGIGSGVRRIEAITGRAALDAAKQDRLTIERMASELKTKAPQIEERLHQVLAEAKETAKELEQIRKEVSAAGAADIIAGKVMVGDVEFVGAAVKASSIDELRDLADMGLDKLNGSGVVLVGAAMGDDKVNFVCKVSKDVVGKGVKAGNIVKAAAQVAGGNGGGRPDMAQAGGKEPAKLMEALKAGGEALKSMLQ